MPATPAPIAEGRCLCGAVTVTAEGIRPHVHACHCGMCRKWAGGPGMAAECEGGVRFTGGESVTNYGSSDWAERGFCATCGTHLYYRLKGTEHYFLPVGLFDTGLEPVLSEEVYYDHKPAYYAFAGETKKKTEAEVMAEFSGGG